MSIDLVDISRYVCHVKSIIHLVDFIKKKGEIRLLELLATCLTEQGANTWLNPKSVSGWNNKINYKWKAQKCFFSFSARLGVEYMAATTRVVADLMFFFDRAD